jgi:hypothetical protein
MDYRALSKELEGRRIRCINMVDDPNPIEQGTEGTIVYVDDAGTIHIKWDNGRTLGMVHGVDQYEIINEVVNEGKIKGSFNLDGSHI